MHTGSGNRRKLHRAAEQGLQSGAKEGFTGWGLCFQGLDGPITGCLCRRDQGEAQPSMCPAGISQKPRRPGDELLGGLRTRVPYFCLKDGGNLSMNITRLADHKDQNLTG